MCLPCALKHKNFCDSLLSISLFLLESLKITYFSNLVDMFVYAIFKIQREKDLLSFWASLLNYPAKKIKTKMIFSIVFKCDNICYLRMRKNWNSNASMKWVIKLKIKIVYGLGILCLLHPRRCIEVYCSIIYNSKNSK